MTEEERDRIINDLAKSLHETNLEMKARYLVMQDLYEELKEYEAKFDELKVSLSHAHALLEDEIKRRQAAERKVAELTAKLKQ